MDQDQFTVGIEDLHITLQFTIADASPPVVPDDIQWIFSMLFTNDPFDGGNTDITSLSGSSGGSTYLFSDDRLVLNMSNISQVDEGRYFFIATNPAGVNFNHIDIIVHGQSVRDDFLHTVRDV